MNAFLFTAQGVRFRGAAEHRYMIFFRHHGSGRPHVYVWHGFRSVLMPKAAQHAFMRCADQQTTADVYCVDTIAREVVAHAHKTAVQFDRINPNHAIDNRAPTCEAPE